MELIVTIICTVITATSPIIIAILSKHTTSKMNKLTDVKEEFKGSIKEILDKIDNNEKDHLRFEILSFAGDLRNGVVKTRQEFETIFAFHDKYEMIIKTLNLTNGYLDSEFDYIKEKYKEL